MKILCIKTYPVLVVIFEYMLVPITLILDIYAMHCWSFGKKLTFENVKRNSENSLVMCEEEAAVAAATSDHQTTNLLIMCFVKV